MLDHTTTIFSETSEGWLFLVFGICSSLVALFFFFRKRTLFQKGIAYVFITMGLFQFTIGSTILIKGPANRIRLETQIKLENKEYIQMEIGKTKTLLENLNFYKWTGISFFIVGCLVLYNFDNSSSWRGIGIGLIIQSLIMQILNYTATSRNEEMMEFLKAL